MSLSIKYYANTEATRRSRKRKSKTCSVEGRWEGKAWKKETRHKEEIIETTPRA